MRPKRGAGREQGGDLSVAKRSHCVCDPEACTRASAITYGRYYAPEGYGHSSDPIQPIRHHGPEGYDHYYGPEDYGHYYDPEGYGPDPIHPNHDPEGYDHYYDPEDYDHYYGPECYDHGHKVRTRPKHDLRI